MEEKLNYGSSGTDEIMQKHSYVFTSVIIPVYNDSRRLQRCLEALKRQTYPEDFFEVIVVDNNSNDDPESVVRKFPGVIFCRESAQGVTSARNKGISVAKGEIIAFTDSDCIPETDWIEKGVSGLSKVPNCGLLAGKVGIVFKDPDHPAAVELFDGNMFFNQEKNIKDHNFGVTANLFTFKHVLDNVGLFNNSLFSNTGEDMEWGYRVFSAGYRQIYGENVCVKHPAIISWSHIRDKTARYILGNRINMELRKKKSNTFVKFISGIGDKMIWLFKHVAYIWSDKNIKGARKKIAVTGVLLCMNFVAIWERIRITCGRTPAGEK